jgi:hypothetical protein
VAQTNASPEGVHVPAAEVRRILKIYEKDHELLEKLAKPGIGHGSRAVGL